MRIKRTMPSSSSSSPLLLLPSRTISSFVVVASLLLLLVGIAPSSAQEAMAAAAGTNVVGNVGTVGNWDILYDAAEIDASTTTVRLGYRIGSGRMYDVELFERDCSIPIVVDDDDGGVHFAVSRTYEYDGGMASSSLEEGEGEGGGEGRLHAHDVLEITLYLVGGDGGGSTSPNGDGGLWIDGERRLQFCVRVRLLSVGSMGGALEVIKEE